MGTLKAPNIPKNHFSFKVPPYRASPLLIVPFKLQIRSYMG